MCSRGDLRGVGAGCGGGRCRAAGSWLAGRAATSRMPAVNCGSPLDRRGGSTFEAGHAQPARPRLTCAGAGGAPSEVDTRLCRCFDNTEQPARGSKWREQGGCLLPRVDAGRKGCVCGQRPKAVA